jgi:hypothetical protein
MGASMRLASAGPESAAFPPSPRFAIAPAASGRPGGADGRVSEVKFLSDILTGKDNLTYDAARVVGVIGAFAYVAFWAVQVWHASAFSSADARSYGEGLGLVLVAMAGAVKLKASEEPQPK